MKRLSSDTNAISWVGSSERLMILCLGTSGVSEQRQPTMPVILLLFSKGFGICGDIVAKKDPNRRVRVGADQ